MKIFRKTARVKEEFSTYMKLVGEMCSLYRRAGASKEPVIVAELHPRE